jgi:hypothetical protein
VVALLELLSPGTFGKQGKLAWVLEERSSLVYGTSVSKGGVE